MTTLFDDWAARFARGESPDPGEYLERAGDQAAELERMMEAFLIAAPRHEPDAQAVELARAWLQGASPLAELRARRGIRRDDVVDAIVGEFALTPEQRPVVKRYYHRLESGELDPTTLSAPLLGLLTRVLEVSRESILAWRARPIAAAPAFRGVQVALHQADSADSNEDDESVRSLFISGR